MPMKDIGFSPAELFLRIIKLYLHLTFLYSEMAHVVDEQTSQTHNVFDKYPTMHHL